MLEYGLQPGETMKLCDYFSLLSDNGFPLFSGVYFANVGTREHHGTTKLVLAC